MTSLVQTVMGLIDQHPNWVTLITFLTAMSEAVAVIGLFVPGTAILIGVGSLVGLGHLALWPILASATLGAVIGDGVSYWLGHCYRDRISSMWPFRDRPQLLARGQAFFTRHGAKSIAIGRFLPVLRAIVPLIAGMAHMRPRRFYVANVASAIAWAPAHILPGAAMGISLGSLGGISSRPIVLIVCSVAVTVGVAWILRSSIMRAFPIVAILRNSLARWAKSRTDIVARASAAALGLPDARSRALLILGSILVGSAIAIFGLL